MTRCGQDKVLARSEVVEETVLNKKLYASLRGPLALVLLVLYSSSGWPEYTRDYLDQHPIEIVDANHVVSGRQERLDQMKANKAGGAGNKNGHAGLPS